MEKLNCFVILPFSDTKIICNGIEKIISSDEWEHIYNNWIKKAVESYGPNFQCKKSPLAPGNFIKGIVNDLSTAAITIADLTGGKPNVYYELGIRHSLQTGTIIISQNLSDLPSDLRAYHCFEYHYTDEAHKYNTSYLSFEKGIHSCIKYILDNNFPPDSPVSDYLDRKKIKRVKKTKVFGPGIVVLTAPGEGIVIPVAEILYLSVSRAYSTVHLLNEKHYTLDRALDRVLRQINNEAIVRVHRSFAVNKYKIRSIRKDEIELVGEIKIPIEEPYKIDLVM